MPPLIIHNHFRLSPGFVPSISAKLLANLDFPPRDCGCGKQKLGDLASPAYNFG